MSQLTSLYHLALTVTDVDRSVPWYVRVLELKEVRRRDDTERGIRKVLLRAPEDAFTVVLVQHPDTERGARDERRPGLDHVAFKVDSYAALKRWEQRLAEYGVSYTPATSSRTMPGAAVLVFYDPDGIQLEVWADLES
jgi:glyoxylase I family protein